MSKSILITGGAGTIGKILVERLVARGHRVRVLTLPDDAGAAAFGPGIEVRYGDISDPQAVDGLCNGIDTVLHLAAVIIADDERVFDKVNVTGTRYLLTDAANHGVGHFIHVSSASVIYRKITPYSRSKRIAERYVRESKLPWTIIRPTLVYSETGGGLEFDMFIRYLLSWPVVPFIGAGRALKRPVYLGDIIDGLEKTVQLDHGRGATYNFSGGSAISMLDFARLCLTLLGREDKPIVSIPVALCLLTAAIMKRCMKRPLLKWNMIAGVVQDANLDPAEAIRDLGYNPYPVEMKLKDCFPRKIV